MRDFYNMGGGALLAYVVIGEIGAAILTLLLISIVGALHTEFTTDP